MIPVILSGGSGTRLWPLSREQYPKQFLPLTADGSMLQETLARLDGIEGVGAPLLVCNEGHRFLVAEQLRERGIEAGGILLEPVGRNTAPALAVAALAALEQDPEAILVALPSDHVIGDLEAFHAALRQGLAAAGKGAMVTFGVVPDRPETGYGYIRAAAAEGEVRPVAAFEEKPDRGTAERYVASGDCFWNSGMFMFRASTYVDELDRHAPRILGAAREALAKATRDLDFIRLDREAFEDSPSDSIDYAVMEHTDRAVVVPLDAGWSDVGSWSALQEVSERDPSGNVVLGDVLLRDVSDSYVRAEHRLVAAVGIRDHVVVETADAVLVAGRDHVQEVKAIVEMLRAQGREESAFHRRVHRPWGWYEGIAAAERFQVKRIFVRPGGALSLQMHHHRAEHWVVVRGSARVTRGDDVFLLAEEESTYIPLGTKHRLENPGKIPLELIEVQTGAYLGEDDIVRYDDNYGRGP
ncbi:MAG TPA: mannose-1-phosphate guanylyltransferase/mannose-6-phosphate isomerase [Gammaproteobacteria bacterium]|nr:mannose-1-phosphate guanylyltransferase/mannose-6-phosphate isomerase [Gammaproteobacteria bacterium]